MSLATLRYERAAPKTNESKQGIPIFDGTPAGFYEWEFRAMTRYHSTDDEDRWKLASKLCEGLTGESLKVAMALGVDKLSQKGGVLNRSWWKPLGPTCSQCLLLMPSLPSEDGESRQKPLESSPFQGGSHKFKPRVSCLRKLCKTNHFFVGYLLGRSRRCCSFSGSWR